MTTYYTYSLSVVIHIDDSAPTNNLASELNQLIGSHIDVSDLIHFEDDKTPDSSHSLMAQIQFTFPESEMEEDEPCEFVLEQLENEITGYIEPKFHVRYLEILDDALTTCFLGSHSD